MEICTLNKIAACGTARLGAGYTVTDKLDAADGVLVRSAAMHDMALPERLAAIARAGAGVNNIPVDLCSEKGIVVFNTPGANANAVKELVLAGLLLSSRRIVAGADWAQGLKGEGDAVAKLVEKGKSAFAGPEILGKKLGVIGLGAIGVLVANAAVTLGMEVYGYDPYLSVDAAWHLSRAIRHAKTLDEIYADCDYITVHVPLTPDTKGMIGTDAIAAMKNGVRILNFARGGLVDNGALLAALSSGKVASYVTDFPSDDLLGVENAVCLPHLGASTPESEDNCAVMAADELKDYLENGNITHSVNYPDMSVPRSGDARICVLHKNVPNMLAQISAVVSAAGMNIASMTNKSRKDLAYTVLDIEGTPDAAVAADILKIRDVIRVRVL